MLRRQWFQMENKEFKKVQKAFDLVHSRFLTEICNLDDKEELKKNVFSFLKEYNTIVRKLGHEPDHHIEIILS